MDKLKSILNDITQQPGVTAAIVIGWDGFAIESSDDEDLDTDAVGAVISTGIGAAQVMGNELRVGELTQAMCEFSNGIIFMSGVGDRAILAVLADPQGNVGNIRYQVRKRLPELAEIL